MQNYLIYFRNKSLEVTHKLYVRAENENHVVESAKRYFGLSKRDYYLHDYMDLDQSKKKNIPLICV